MQTFSEDYFACRERFRKAARLAGWHHESVAIDAAGAGGEELTIDFAASDRGNADRLLVVTSGLHGVEGPLGSAVQSDLMLGRFPDTSGLGCLLIHALNPYGFAWSRRFDDRNIDPNRNFLLPGEAYEGEDPLYGRLAPLLNPGHPPRRFDPFLLKAAWLIWRVGTTNLKQAIARGQFERPQGLFFGGDGPSQTQTVLAERLGDWVGQPESIAHLDFHTGLGRWTACKLLVDFQLTADERARMSGWFGSDVIEDGASNHQVGYQMRGGFGRWFRAQLFAREYFYACVEFGTYDSVKVLAGLRRENQAHHWTAPGDRRWKRAKRRLRELFCPRSRIWRERTLEQSHAIVDQAIAGLNAMAFPNSQAVRKGQDTR